MCNKDSHSLSVRSQLFKGLVDGYTEERERERLALATCYLLHSGVLL